MKKRLDLVLVERGLAPTRSRAAQIIKSGSVMVSGKIVKKAGYLVDHDDNISVSDPFKGYVSRAGIKLEHALKCFKVDVAGKVCLDVGSSTGGFTQCLLNAGAKLVYAVDVGKDQMHDSLRGDPRIRLFECTDVRRFDPGIKFDIVSVDVSFISLRLILEHVRRLAKENSSVVVLIKPQFEAGREHIKAGLVKDPAIIERVIEAVKGYATDAGFSIVGIVESPVLGKDGNREFLMHLRA